MTQAAAPRQVAALRPLRQITVRLVDLWRSRELLRQFVSKELKIRYKNSALGFLWSMLTPAMLTVVFTVVLGFILRIPIPDFAAFFLAGFLVFQFFQTSVTGSVDSIVGNGNLIKKVWFPRELLPMSIVISQFIHLLLAVVAVSPYFIAKRGAGMIAHLPAALVAMVLLAIFTAGVAMLFAGANVFFRDLKELTVVIFTVWFYATPVIYPLAMVKESSDARLAEVAGWVNQANPMTWFVSWFRQSTYGSVEFADGAYVAAGQTWPDPLTIGVCAGWAAGMFIVGYLAFQRFARNFAKEV